MNQVDLGFKILFFIYMSIKFPIKLFRLSEPELFLSVKGQLL